MQDLFTAQAANDVTKANAIEVTRTGVKSLHAFGTWDGATLSVFLSLNGTDNGVLLSDLTFIDDGFVDIEVDAGTTIWGELTGVGTTSVSLKVSSM